VEETVRVRRLRRWAGARLGASDLLTPTLLHANVEERE